MDSRIVSRRQFHGARSTMFQWLGVLALAIGAPVAYGQTNLMLNGSFESDPLPGGVGYTNVFSGWEVTGGTLRNGNALQAFYHTASNGAVPDGVQVAGSQGAGTFSQTLTGLSNAMYCTPSFYICKRADGGSNGDITLTVKLGTQTIYGPTVVNWTTFTLINLTPFFYNAGWGNVITFIVSDPVGDATLLLDHVVFNTVPGYTVTPSITGGSGSITPNTVQTVVSGGSASFSIAASSGYRIRTVRINGVVQSEPLSSYTFNNVTTNSTIAVAFEGPDWTFDISGFRDGWAVENQIASWGVSNDRLVYDIAASATDPMWRSQWMSLPRANMRWLRVIAQNQTKCTGCLMFWDDNTIGGFTGGYQASYAINPNDTQLSEYWVDMNTLPLWNAASTIEQFRFDFPDSTPDGTPLDSGGSHVEVDRITFFPSASGPPPPAFSSIAYHNPSGSGWTNAGTLVWDVRANHTMNTITLDDFTITPAGTASGTVALVTPIGPTWCRVTANVGALGTGTLRLDGVANGPARDVANQPIASAFTGGDVYNVDRDAPSVTISAPSKTLTNTGPVTYTVTFADTGSGLASTTLTGKITLNKTDSANGTIGISGANPYTVTISGLTGSGSLGITVGAGSAADNVGNASVQSSPSATFAVDNNPPSFTSIAANPSSVSVGDPVTITFDASEALTGNPSVTVNGHAATYQNNVGNSYTYAYSTVVGMDAAGSASVGISGTDTAGNPGSGVSTFTITKASATVTLGNLNPTYDGTPKSATATTTPSGLSVSFTYNGSATAPTNAGNYAVVGTINDANYQGSASDTMTIAKASATVSLSNLAHTYDGTAKSAAATTTPPGLTVNITYNGSATAPTNAGSYAVAATINDANYQGNASGTLSIAKAAATVTLSNLLHTYDGAAKSATATTTPPGLTVDITYDGAAAAPANAGDYDVVATVNDVNYQGSAGDAMRISKATATVALSGLNQTYDGAPKPIGAATTPAGLAVDITYNGQPTAPTNAGSYPVAAAVNEANYQGTASDTLVIAKAASVISEAPTASDITYGQTLADSGLSGGAGTPSGAFAFTTPATMPNAGTAAQPVTFTPVDTLNYTAAAGTASVTVHPKAFTVSVVNNPTKLYNGTIDATLTENHFQVSGLVPGENVSITETAGVYDSAEIGARTVTVALEAGDFTAGAGTDLANYTLPTQATGPGTITDKFIPVITIPPTAGAITYGQTLAASSLTGGEARYGGAVVTGTFEFTDDSIAPDAGTYNASVTFTPTDTAIYASASANAAVTVNKAAATVTLDNLSHTYDGVAHPATVTTSPEGLGVDITYGGAAAAPMNAGTYAVVATIDDANYQGTAADTLVIAPAALTVTADAKSKMAGEADPALTYQITAGALVPGDALSGALTREPGEAVGTYAILQGTLTAGPNYDLTYVGADLTITSNEVFTVVYTGPSTVPVVLDGRLEITVTAVNYTGEVDYQWYRVRPDKALQLIEGATGPTLVIEPVTLDDAGFYICEATWEGGSDFSPEIEVRVEETPGLPAAGLLGAGALFVTLSLAGVRVARRRTPHTA